MTTDFGAPKRRSRLPIGWIVTALWLLVLIGLAGGKFYLDRQAAIKIAQTWSASGPPCPIGLAPPDDGYRFGERAMGFEGTKYIGDFHAAKCGTTLDHGGTGQGVVAVCKIKGASYITVSTAKGRYQFVTSGQKATISIEGGPPTCVLDAG
jgi:hypothetical protein